MILIDEGWKALDDPVFAGRIRDWMKTLRKRNALVGFGTQSARDALESRISAPSSSRPRPGSSCPMPRRGRRIIAAASACRSMSWS
jgi:type IV secretion system protein VirB4